MHIEFGTEKKRNDAAEKAANEFAMNVLFGKPGVEPFRGLTRDREIAEKARQLGIAPGVAVHQMHRRRLLDLSVRQSSLRRARRHLHRVVQP